MAENQADFSALFDEVSLEFRQRNPKPSSAEKRKRKKAKDARNPHGASGGMGREKMAETRRVFKAYGEVSFSDGGEQRDTAVNLEDSAGPYPGPLPGGGGGAPLPGGPAPAGQPGGPLPYGAPVR